MYTYNNMLYKHNKTHFSDFESSFALIFTVVGVFFSTRSSCFSFIQVELKNKEM